MAVIEKRIKLRGSKGEAEVQAIFDSGSTYSCIKPLLAEKLGAIESLPTPKSFGTAEDGRNLEAHSRVSLDIYINGYCLSDEFTPLDIRLLWNSPRKTHFTRIKAINRDKAEWGII